MSNKNEQIVSNFYNNYGWDSSGESTQDALLFEDLRPIASEYLSKCRIRVQRHIPENGENILDFASGPIQYKEYLNYSKNFKKRYCVDLSTSALEIAKNKIGDHGVYINQSLFDIDFSENYFDSIISLHTIYHIDKDLQKKAVEKLLFSLKPGKKLIIVYSNPNNFLTLIKKFINLFKKKKKLTKPEFDLYYYNYPNTFWNSFNEIGNVTILPWRTFSSDDQKRLIPNNNFGKQIFKFLYYLEERFPVFFSKYAQYPMIIINKY